MRKDQKGAQNGEKNQKETNQRIDKRKESRELRMDKKGQITEKGKRTKHTYKKRGKKMKKRIKKKKNQRIDEIKKEEERIDKKNRHRKDKRKQNGEQTEEKRKENGIKTKEKEKIGKNEEKRKIPNNLYQQYRNLGNIPMPFFNTSLNNRFRDEFKKFEPRQCTLFKHGWFNLKFESVFRDLTLRAIRSSATRFILINFDLRTKLAQLAYLSRDKLSELHKLLELPGIPSSRQQPGQLLLMGLPSR